MSGGRGYHCWLRGWFHSWARGIKEGGHVWKACSECGIKRMTHHVDCHSACWGGAA